MTAPSFERDVAIGALPLDCGVTLDDVVQRVTVYGTPNDDRSNVALVAHALTGSSQAARWWGGMVGPGAFLDTNELAVVCVNALGSCYGSTGPASIAPDGRPYGARFPVTTVSDMVRAQYSALAAVGFTDFVAVVGGSLGGMQALVWALEAPHAVEHAIVIGAYDHFSAMGIALNAVAREAIRIARTPHEGIALARKIAMLTYKSDALLASRFDRAIDRSGGDPYVRADDRFDVEGYLDHQGRIFTERMDVDAYLTLTRAMDLFDVRAVAARRNGPALTFVGITSDWLFLPRYVRDAAKRYAHDGARSTYVEFASDHGHDAFLAETGALVARLRDAIPDLAGTHVRRPASVRAPADPGRH